MLKTGAYKILNKTNYLNNSAESVVSQNNYQDGVLNWI
jgi:hypothetical protein